MYSRDSGILLSQKDLRRTSGSNPPLSAIPLKNADKYKKIDHLRAYRVVRCVRKVRLSKAKEPLLHY